MRCAIVTGAGTGIGAATARALARDGHAILLAGRRAGPLERLAAELGPDCAVVAADVGSADGATAIAAAATARFGRVDVLVNNAGVGESGPLLDEPLEQWEATLRTNL